MQIWIPEPIYRVWPQLNWILGIMFAAISPGTMSMVLALGLAAHGAWRWYQRRSYELQGLGLR